VPLRVSHLRRWFAASAVALILIVAGFYLYARHRVRNALKEVPEKIGLEIQQSAKGFTISKSNQGRTLFKIQASKAVQFKAGGRGELHDVEITVYGRDSGRFDRIIGKDFEYDAVTGDVTGKGEVQIDLETNPAGIGDPDQSPPKDLKNPVHLKTSDLVFNQKTGDAHANGEVEFDVPQAHGSALGLTYVARNNALSLNSQVAIAMNGLVPMSLTADRLTLSRVPRQLVLEHPHVIEGYQHSTADKATAFLSSENKLERVVAEGNLVIDSRRPGGGKITAGEMELLVGQNNHLQHALLQRDVRLTSIAQGDTQATAGRALLHFSSQGKIKNVHADENVLLKQVPASENKQSLEITAPAMDFVMAGDGRLIRHAETAGPPKITFAGDGSSPEPIEVTAGKFQADFDTNGQLTTLHGAPSVKIVSKADGKPDRISTSQSLDAHFHHGQTTAFSQVGDFTYSDGQLKASAGTAQYNPQSQIMTLRQAPRVTDGAMTTSADSIQLNRLTGSAHAEGNVRTTDLPQNAHSGAGMFSASGPFHVVAQNLTATSNPATAIYQGNVRLWQNGQSVTAPYLKFERDSQTIKAKSSPNQRVSAHLNQADQDGRTTAVDISADQLEYSGEASALRVEGSVIASGRDVHLSANSIQCYFKERGSGAANKGEATSAAINKIVAEGDIVISQPGRRATGNRLIYTASEDKYVLTGGPPSIFDAERGNVTGDSLTLFGHDARVLVEGSKQTPAVTETRVAR
jgi:lipopolysaccharide export system protein LptA